MKASARFDAAECEYHKSGHSHVEIDQRFSVVATTISAAPTLEEPLEFQEWMLAHIHPRGGRTLHVEILDHTLDWTSWFMPLNLQVTGLGATKNDPHANHVWRIVSRNVLAACTGFTSDAVQCNHSDWTSIEPDNDDAILLVKESMHSLEYSQEPQLLLPACVAASLDSSKLTVAPKNLMTPEVLKQFRKTAHAISQPPWNLVRGATYLLDLCDSNENHASPTIVLPSFVLTHQMKTDTAALCLSRHLTGSMTEGPEVLPRLVSAHKPGPAETRRRTLMKRPAALRTCPAAVLEEAAKHDEVAEHGEAAEAGEVEEQDEAAEAGEVAEHDEAAEAGEVAEHKEFIMLCSRVEAEEHEKATVDEGTADHVADHLPAEHKKAEKQVLKRPHAASVRTDLGGGWHKCEHIRSGRDKLSGQTYYTFCDACGNQYRSKKAAVAAGCPA